MKIKLICIALFTCIAGCASSGNVARDVRTQAAVIAENASVLTASANKPFEAQEQTRTNEVWIPVRVVKTHAEKRIPDEYDKQIVMSRSFSKINEVAERISFHSGMPVIVTPDVFAKPMGVAGATPSIPVQTPSPSGLPLPGGMSGAASQSGFQEAMIDVAYSGKLSGFLDVICARYGLSWRFIDGRIEIFRIETRTFTVKAIPGDIGVMAAVDDNTGGATTGGGGAGGAGGGAGGGGGAGTQSVTANATLSVWDNLSSSMTSMTSPYGKFSVNRAIGTITVTDTPVALSQISKFIDEQNAILSMQVLLSVKVYSIATTDSDAQGINWSAVFGALSKNYGITYATPFAAPAAAASLTMSVLTTAGAGNPQANIGTLVGSKAIVSALATQGRVSQVTSWSGVTMNNQPAPVTVGKSHAYLQSVASVATANVGTSTTLTPGTFVTGFAMNVLPHIIDDDKIMLQFMINISSLANMLSVSSGNQSIQAPEIDSRKMLQRISMRSGQTLILTGFESGQYGKNEQSTGLPKAVGGMDTYNRNKDVIVVVITPIVSGGI